MIQPALSNRSFAHLILMSMLIAWALGPFGLVHATGIDRAAGALEPSATTLISVSSAGAQTDASSAHSAVSVGGRYIAFESSASNLVAGDTNAMQDIFVHDRQTGLTERVSVDSAGGQADGSSAFPQISADGRFVVFSSEATNLVSEDTNSVLDVFVRDRESGETSRVSVAADGAQGDGWSYIPSISTDGRFIVFASGAANLVAGDLNGYEDVFVHDRQSGEISLVSVASDGTQGDFYSQLPTISSDGRFVAFESNASNLVAGDTNHTADVFVHDRQSGDTWMVSVSSGVAQGDDWSYDPYISSDGRTVVFTSDASNLVDDDINNTPDVFVHDLQTSQTQLVSLAGDGQLGNAASWEGGISADGRFVAFISYASNLVPGDANDLRDAFVVDRQTGEVARVSVSSAGGEANGASEFPSISPDGFVVGFASYADNLVEGDVNNVCDLNSDGDYKENCPDVFINARSSGEMIFLALVVKD